jgi:hypothetical protein
MKIIVGYDLLDNIIYIGDTVVTKNLVICELLGFSLTDPIIRLKDLKTKEIITFYTNKNNNYELIKLPESYNTLVTLFLLKN